ncbi:hypothetical protein GCM10023258_26410 [Terrabacter aeriphilus]|uniref:Uncharacterized protein n=1 Tax=Terrabacter aeriphilus TaxID=515662 RepID=A0ABP9JF62_9MICO
MKDVRENVVPGRLAAALVGLVGVLAALPTVVLPTQAITNNPAADAGSFTVPDTEQLYWSWGRVVDATPGLEDTVTIGDAGGLVALALALAAGLAGAAAYAFRRGAEGRVLGAVGLAWAASQLVGSIARRLGDTIFGFFSEGQFVLETRPAGVLEVVSAVLLVVATLLVVLRPLAAVVRSGVTLAQQLSRRGVAPVEPRPGDLPARETPRVGIATIRDVAPGSGRGGPSSGARWSGSPSGVGFSDAGSEAGQDAGRDGGARQDHGPDSGRFRPPR